MMYRNHPITGAPIVYAPERSARPGAFGGDDADRCPFCAGHESDTPPTIVSVGDPWRVRVVANKYPSVGGAEVIVESPRHDETFDRLEHTEDIVRMYVDRYRAHSHAAHVALFKNHGPAAGASIPHIHSQVMPLPFLPPRVQREGDAFEHAAHCPLCTPIDGHLIRETQSFRWLAPSASEMPYQQWIIPKRHIAEIAVFEDHEIAELATLLRSASAAMLTVSDSYNWIFMNFARRSQAHCYIELFPRVATFGGFELGTGTLVQIVDPEIAAKRFRVDQHERNQVLPPTANRQLTSKQVSRSDSRDAPVPGAVTHRACSLPRGPRARWCRRVAGFSRAMQRRLRAQTRFPRGADPCAP